MANPCDYRWHHGLASTASASDTADGPFGTMSAATDGTDSAYQTQRLGELLERFLQNLSAT